MNASARRVAARILTVIGALLLVAASIVGWADRTIFDADAFGARARASLEDPAVRTVVARTLVRSVLESANPDVIAVRPLLESAVTTVVATPAFGNVFEGAARATGRLLLEEDSDNVVVRSNEALLLIIDTIREYAPNIAAQIPESVDAALLRVRDVSDELRIWRFASTVQELAWILPVLALVAWTLAVALARDRRRTVEGIGLATAVGGLVVLVGLRIGAGLVAGAIDDPVSSDAGRAVWNTFTDGLRTLGWFGIGIGLLVTAAAFAARPEPSRLDPAQLRARIGPALRANPSSRWGWVARIVLAGGLGIFMIAAPRRFLELVVVTVGVALVYVALVTAFELLARPDTDGGRPVRHRRTVVVAVVLGIVLAVGTTLVLIEDSPEPQAISIGCNGRVDLCGRRLDQMVFPTSHNANAAADDGYLGANQSHGIASQLAQGIRGLQLDAFLGTPRGGRVFTDFTDINVDALTATVGSDLVDRAEQARAIIGPPPDSARQDLYLCHGFCELGATRASRAFTDIATFLARNPNEVLFVIFEDYAPVDRLERELARAGLADQRYAVDPDEPLPTLREMIRSGRRLVTVLENQDGGPEMPNGYTDGIIQETPYTFRNAAALEAPESCGPERGLATAPIFLLNHWVTPASRSGSIRVNQFPFLDERARRCQEERGLLPNLIAIDFVEEGDLDAVVDQLNEEARR